MLETRLGVRIKMYSCKNVVFLFVKSNSDAENWQRATPLHRETSCHLQRLKGNLLYHASTHFNIAQSESYILDNSLPFSVSAQKHWACIGPNIEKWFAHQCNLLARSETEISLCAKSLLCPQCLEADNGNHGSRLWEKYKSEAFWKNKVCLHACMQCARQENSLAREKG